MEEYRGACPALRDSVLAVVVSFLLFYFGFGEFIFVFPLLLLASRYKKKVSALSILVEAVLVVSYSFFTRVDGLLGFLLMCFELFIPLSLLAAGATWLATEKRGIGTRLFIALLPSLVFFAIIYVFLEQEPALLGEYLKITENAFEALLSPFINVGAMGEEFWSVFCTTILLIVVSMIIPVVLCFVCVTCFSYESVAFKRKRLGGEGGPSRVGREGYLDLSGSLAVGTPFTLYFHTDYSRYRSIQRNAFFHGRICNTGILRTVLQPV